MKKHLLEYAMLACMLLLLPASATTVMAGDPCCSKANTGSNTIATGDVRTPLIGSDRLILPSELEMSLITMDPQWPRRTSDDNSSFVIKTGDTVGAVRALPDGVRDLPPVSENFWRANPDLQMMALMPLSERRYYFAKHGADLAAKFEQHARTIGKLAPNVSLLEIQFVWVVVSSAAVETYAGHYIESNLNGVMVRAKTSGGNYDWMAGCTNGVKAMKDPKIQELSVHHFSEE